MPGNVGSRLLFRSPRAACVAQQETILITDRRSIMAGLALVAASSTLAMAQAIPSAPDRSATPMNFAGMKTAPEFYMGVLGPAEVSLST